MTELTTCRDCSQSIDPTGATVPTLCPTCYDKHRERIKTEFLSLIDGGADIDQLLDELRWRLLELGLEREHAERSVDRVRLATLLDLPFQSVADR